jgi:parallel beta-helix repeat protein
VSLIGLTIQGAQGSQSAQNAGVDVLDGSSYITVSSGRIANNHSYGVDVNGSTYVTISGNTITGNDTGIRINRAGAGVLIDSNDVVNNTGMVVNDPAPGTDWGAVGISFLHTVGPLVARNNTIHGNRAQSDDYGYDGGAFEIYGSSGATMASNRIWDNQDVLETGTDGVQCANNVFVRNVAWGGNNKALVTPRGPQVNGIILRCGQNMLIANNTFQDLDYWVYDISASGGFAGNIAGFKIENNVAYQASNKIYAIEVALPSDAVIDHNVSYNAQFAPFASVPGTSFVKDIASFRSLEGGREGLGKYANPLFANLGGLDFRLAAGSPAIDAGVAIAGVTDGYRGAAPDAGAYES